MCPHTEAKQRASAIKLMIFDVDGVLTDGSLHYSADGELVKTFNALDGHGIKLLQQAGIQTAIISARTSAAVSRRAQDLGIGHLYQGVGDKRSAFAALLAQTQLRAQDCGFIGDDVIDLPILCQVGFAASVPTGHAEVQSRVHYICSAAAGRGAVRELCDFILQAQNKYEAILQTYLS